MLWVEIPVRNEPVIYRAKKCAALVPREQRKKIYKFANKTQALRLLKKYRYDVGFIQGCTIAEMLIKAAWIPEIYPVKKKTARAEVRAWLKEQPEAENADETDIIERMEHYERDFE